MSNVGRDSRSQIFNELEGDNKKRIDFLHEQHSNEQPELGERFYDGISVDSVLKNLYQYEKTLDLRIRSEAPQAKETILNQIGQRFNDSSYKLTILYFSGQTDQFSAAWIVSEPKSDSAEDKWSSVIVYRDIAKLWAKRTDHIASRMLLIIIDASYSGYWSKRCYDEADFEDIAVIASAGVNQKAQDTGFGGYFTYNFMEAVRPFGEDAIFVEHQPASDRQNITSMGVGIMLDKMFELRIFYVNWTELFANR